MTLAEHVARQYGDRYLGMEPIPVTGPVDGNMAIRRAYLGRDASRPFFGQILAVLEYKGRFLLLRYHVWEPHQAPSMANRMTGIEELAVRTARGQEWLERTDTNFARKAFWLYTPDAGLDGESLSLRAVARKLKSYSVGNGLCRDFRKRHHGKETTA